MWHHRLAALEPLSGGERQILHLLQEVSNQMCKCVLIWLRSHRCPVFTSVISDRVLSSLGLELASGDNFDLLIFLPPLHKSWDYRYAPSHTLFIWH